MMKEINRFSSLLGFEKTLTPMKAARVKQILKKPCHYTFYGENMNEDGNKIMSEAEFIVYTLQEGRQPSKCVERPCHRCTEVRCVGDDVCTKGKDTYHMCASKYSTNITKTGYDFAQWLIAENLITFDAVQLRIRDENAENRKTVQETARKENEQRAIEEAEQFAESEYQEWLNERFGSYGDTDAAEGEKVLIQRDIFLDILGGYSDRAKDLLVLIDNIENPRCRRDIISRLHNSNRACIKTFEHITGIKLAKTNKERAAQLQSISKKDYAENPKQYKPRKSSKTADYQDVFFRRMGWGDAAEFVEARGRLWQYGGYDFYISVAGDKKKRYDVTEGRTGLLVARGETLKHVQDAARERTKNTRNGKPVNTPLAETLQQFAAQGTISPLYK